MLSVMSGTVILIISELKTFRNEIYSVDDLLDTTNLSKPTIIKSLKRLEEFNIINSTNCLLYKYPSPRDRQKQTNHYTASKKK
ncbi:hypothetical protein BGU62_19605 [Clostridioides difficile]|uniref:ArsR family transcriptional regulator n=1 Tax=Clostridioides difficile TaxID=1496 RepID=UPI000BB1E9C7|nr:hypothetical protein BGU62_19605 [Clostridioides difficile]